ncbi:flagellar biosynthesis repressor FlbT [Paracoccus ravus]|uniref:flagellar biosynthesis repressor FlbT n=1 Tax=Paracoccus ravus TaxID=2447760 RepID=UPI001430B20F|nr:flagellar biosynthesis repressor FlbT [Paracoccus ravus]
MGLKLKVAPGERLVLNGCILRNTGAHRLEIELENRADVLRGSEMLDAETADTPVKRLCYLIQIALVSTRHRAEMLPEITARTAELRSAMAISHGADLDRVQALVEQAEFYAATRILQQVIRHEAKLLKLAEMRVRQAAEAAQTEGSA